MSLIKSISGIRGTIGGKAGEGLSPLDIVKFTAAYATFIRKTTTKTSNTIVVGRDARLSGDMVCRVVTGTLTGMGFDVVNIGLATTPTTELAVVWEKACGGIILTASHNPKQWNALKLLNENGEFLANRYLRLRPKNHSLSLKLKILEKFITTKHITVNTSTTFFRSTWSTRKQSEKLISLSLSML